MKIIKPTWKLQEEIVDFEQGRHLPYNGEHFIFAEGELVRSFEDLQKVAAEDRHRRKEYLTVRFLEMIGGG